MILLNKVKYFRLKFSLTQENLANKVGVTRLTIISIEKQRYEPSVSLAIKLSNVFNCKVEELFWFSEE
ncbi:helix-turn-helix transcriptional regulator [Clostridium ihumii]|uniref:helix-turn-helix transcriptional regulator n=1 Tax=Clostridium ihumii TaxID=1470356 RepID=UPI003D3459C5